MIDPTDKNLSIDQIESINDEFLFRRDGLTYPFDGAQEFWDDIHAYLRQVQRSGIFLDRPRDRRAAQGILDYWASALVRAGEPVPDLHLESFDPSTVPELRGKMPCPYQGLEAFTEPRSEYFFGRESLLDNIVQRIRAGQSYFLVSGASGSGKSSLLRGGLIPRLRKGSDIPGSEGWCFVTMVPGDDPVHNLKEALIGCGGIPRVDDISRPADADTTAVSSQDARLLIVVDQFEEVFTLGAKEVRTTNRDEFVGQLYRLVCKLGALAFLTIRDDYVDDLQQLQEECSRWVLDKDARILVEALSLPELRSAIEKPAEKVGLRFDDGIVDDLAGKVLGQAAGLPLLQFTLLRLWDNLPRNRITKEVYDEVGDPLTSLQKCADKFYRSLIDEDKKLVERMFAQKLVTIEEGKEATRNRAKLKAVFELDDPASLERTARILVNMICKERLITLSGAQPSPCAMPDRERAGELHRLATEQNQDCVPQIEVAHEALIRNWDQLGKWLADERERRRDRWALARAADDWIKKGNRDESYLYTGAQLDHIIRQNYHPLPPAEDEFVSESKKLRDRQKTRKTLLIGGVFIMLVLLLLSISALALLTYKYFRESVFETARMLVDEADEVTVSDPARGLFLAAEAVDKAYARSWPPLDALVGTKVPDSVVNVLEDVMESGGERILLPKPEYLVGFPQLLAISPNTNYVAIATGGTVEDKACFIALWSLGMGDTISPALLWHHAESGCQDQPIAMLLFNRSSSQLMVVKNDGAVDLIELGSGDSTPEPKPVRSKNETGSGKGSEPIVAFSPTWRWMVTELELQEINGWRGEKVMTHTLAIDGVRVVQALFSPDEKWLVSADISNTLKLWNLTDLGQRPSTLPMKGDRIQFDPGSRWLAIASTSPPNVFLRDLAVAGAQPDDYLLGGGSSETSIRSLAFQQEPDSTAQWFAVGYDSGTIHVWNLADLEIEKIDDSLGGEIGQMPDSSEIPTPSSKTSTAPKTVVSVPIEIYEHSGAVDQLAFSAGETNRLMSGSTDGRVRIVEVSNEGYELIGTQYGKKRPFVAVIFDTNRPDHVIAFDGYTLQTWQEKGIPSDVSDMKAKACNQVRKLVDPKNSQKHWEEMEAYLSACQRYSHNGHSDNTTEVPK